MKHYYILYDVMDNGVVIGTGGITSAFGATEETAKETITAMNRTIFPRVENLSVQITKAEEIPLTPAYLATHKFKWG